jgi:hypothetical protein
MNHTEPHRPQPCRHGAALAVHRSLAAAAVVLIAGVCLLGVTAAAGQEAAAPEVRHVLDALVAVLRSGDAAAYETFVQGGAPRPSASSS